MISIQFILVVTVFYLILKTKKNSKHIEKLQNEISELKTKSFLTQEKKPVFSQPLSTAIKESTTKVDLSNNSINIENVETDVLVSSDRDITIKQNIPQSVYEKEKTNEKTNEKGMPESIVVEISDEQAKPDLKFKNQQSQDANDSEDSLNTSLDRFIDYCHNFFTKGNTVAKIGGLILFIGVSFLLKYASEHSKISVEFKLAGVALGSWVLLALGLKFRNREGNYGTLLQGLSMGIFYGVLLSAGRLYEVIPLGMTFIGLFCTSTFLVFLAIRQNSMALAIVAFLGAFASPILTSDGSGNHTVLFAYYTLVNLGLLGVAWFKSWRPLNLIGFFATFGVGGVWGVLKYSNELYASSQFFLIVFFAIFFAISVLYSYHKGIQLKSSVDGTLVFGLPLVCFTLQIPLVEKWEYGIAISSFVLGNIYLFSGLPMLKNKSLGLLGESFLALGVVFYTMAIPFAFDAKLTGAMWVLESLAVLWVSLRQNRNYAKYFAIALQIIAGMSYLSEGFDRSFKFAYLNFYHLGVLFILGSYLTTAFWFFKIDQKVEGDSGQNKSEYDIQKLFLILFCLVLGFSSIRQLAQSEYEEIIQAFIYLGLVQFGLGFFANRIKWKSLINILRYFTWVGLFLSMAYLSELPDINLLSPIMFIGVILFWSANYFNLHLFKNEYKDANRVHRMNLWLLSLLPTVQLVYWGNDFDWAPSVTMASIFLVYLTLYLMIFKTKITELALFKEFKNEYLYRAWFPLSILLIAFELLAFVYDGIVAEKYFPFVFPLDAAQIIGLVILFNVFKKFADKQSMELPIGINEKHYFALFTLLSMVVLSVIWARTTYLFGVKYDAYDLWYSSLFQTGISLLWTCVSVGLMLLAKKKLSRAVWITGAVILGVVVLKLFLVDLSKTGAIARVVSFIGVGVLLLAVGYFAPLPPAKENEQESKENKKSDGTAEEAIEEDN